MRASRRVLLLLAALTPFAILLLPGQASAHTGFESSNPVDGATVDAAVEFVTIAYSAAAEPAGEGFVALDSSGRIRIPDSVVSDTEQRTWTLRFDPPLADGVVGVRWTVQAPDAHPIDGSFSFTVTAPGVPVADDGATAQSNDPATTIPAGGPDSDGVEQSSFGEIASESAGSDGSHSASDVEVSLSETQDLQDFLRPSDQTAPNAAAIGAFGRLLGFVGTMLGIGGLCFGAVVVRNHRRDLRSVFKAVRYAALVVIAGTAIDLVAHLAVASNGWWEILSGGAFMSATWSAFGLAVGLRMVAGSLLFATARIADQDVGRIVYPVPQRELALAGGPRRVLVSDVPWEMGAAERPDHGRFDRGRSAPQSRSQNLELTRSVLVDEPSKGNLASMTGDDWPLSRGSVVAVVLLLVSFTFDGHTVTEGNRWVTGAVDMVHVVAASIWAGGVVAFAVVLWRRYRRRERLGGLEMALRFSVVAGAALAVAGVAGTILAVIILESVSDLWTTPWGRLLIAKTAAVAAAASLGTYNHFVVIPWMNAHSDDDSRSVRIRNTATGEAILLAVVIILTAFLVGAPSQ